MKYKNELLNEREKTHGNFSEVARSAQNLKNYFRGEIKKREDEFTFTQIEAIEMICVKLARIVCGDPNFLDAWRDISAYAELVVEQLEVSDE